MSRRTLRALGVGAAALLAAIAPLGVASAAVQPSAYLVEVEWQSLQPHSLDDCAGSNDLWVCLHSQVYGSLAVETTGGGAPAQAVVRNFGAPWDDVPGYCPSSSGPSWDTPSTYLSNCPRDVFTGSVNPFKNTLMCGSKTYANCVTGWKKNNNKVLVKVVPGQQLKLAAHVRDWDHGGPDDDICLKTVNLGGLTHQALAGLDTQSVMETQFNGDGACKVAYRVRTVGDVL
ncbi:hypothetical protein ACIOMM_35875 [Streptomyces sp. NPDC087908]|uniref:hypothetical protein n=1 Tax=Streptomyces sp. NPDC087908 TaxID=3365820 RepID=UPI003829B9AA